MPSPLVVIWKAPSLRFACTRKASSRPLVGALPGPNLCSLARALVSRRMAYGGGAQGSNSAAGELWVSRRRSQRADGRRFTSYERTAAVERVKRVGPSCPKWAASSRLCCPSLLAGPAASGTARADRDPRCGCWHQARPGGCYTSRAQTPARTGWRSPVPGTSRARSRCRRRRRRRRRRACSSPGMSAGYVKGF